MMDSPPPVEVLFHSLDSICTACKSTCEDAIIIVCALLQLRQVSKLFNACATEILRCRKDLVAFVLRELDTYHCSYPLWTIRFLHELLEDKEPLSPLFLKEAAIRGCMDSVRYYCKDHCNGIKTAVEKSLARKDRRILDYVAERFPWSCSTIDSACKTGDIPFVESLGGDLTGRAILYAAKSDNDAMINWVLNTVELSDEDITRAKVWLYLNGKMHSFPEDGIEVLKNEKYLKRKYFSQIKALYGSVCPAAFIDAILENSHNFNETCWVRGRYPQKDATFLRFILDIVDDAHNFASLFAIATNHDSKYIDTYLEYIDSRGWQSRMIEIPIIHKNETAFRGLMRSVPVEDYIELLVSEFHEGLHLLCEMMPEHKVVELASPFDPPIETLLNLGIAADEVILERRHDPN